MSRECATRPGLSEFPTWSSSSYSSIQQPSVSAQLNPQISPPGHGTHIVFLTAAMLDGWTPDWPVAASWLSRALGVSHSFGRHLGIIIMRLMKKTSLPYLGEGASVLMLCFDTITSEGREHKWTCRRVY